MALVQVIVALLIVILGIASYYGMQQTLVSVQLDIFIAVEPMKVFNYFKDPANLPTIHYIVSEVNIKDLTVYRDGTEYREYEVLESVPHLGILTAAVNAWASPSKLTVECSVTSMHGLVHAQVFWKFQKDPTGGTVVKEQQLLYVPWALKSFANKTATETHFHMLESLKMILEEKYEDYT